MNPTGNAPADSHRPRLLLLLGQSPFDPTSGAAQSTRLIAQMLAREGFPVRALATTACEGDLPTDHAGVLSELDPQLQPRTEAGLICFRHESIDYTLLPVAPAWKHQWEAKVGNQYEAAYARELAEWKPDIILTYGGDSTDTVRRRRARRAGVVVVFALHNLAYRQHPPAEVDSFLAPTQFLAGAYGRLLSAPITVLPVPLDAAHTLGPAPESAAVCFINPEPAKGALLVAQLADRLGRLRPDIPLLIVGGRVPAEGLTVAGRDLGLDLTQYPNLVQVPPTGRVSEIWNVARIVLMPSVVKEAAGRCALEAMLNGAVPLVSDQAGLAEIVGDAGIRLPPPPALSGRARPVPAAIVDAWWEALVRCFDQPEEWSQRSALCRARAATHTLDQLGPDYAEWFRSRLNPPTTTIS